MARAGRTVVDKKIVSIMTLVVRRLHKTRGGLVRIIMIAGAKIPGNRRCNNTRNRPITRSGATDGVPDRTTNFIEAVAYPTNTAAIVMWWRIGVATN